MYVGVILAMISTPLVLGSFWALIPAGMIVILFIVRTYLEDNALKEKLSGYSDYSAQVRFRLIPGIW
jgi:protein-S-isoprenylcysteine O-methyltransferase Ste14